jgi:hypothetical protein
MELKRNRKLNRRRKKKDACKRLRPRERKWSARRRKT